MKRIGVNSVIGLSFICLSMFWMSLIRKLPTSSGLIKFGAGSFPTLIIICITVVSVILIVQDFIKKGNVHIDLNKKDGLKVLIIIVFAFVYLLILPMVGYLISSMLLLAATLWLFGLRKKIPFALTAVIFPSCLYLVFQVLLKVQLP